MTRPAFAFFALGAGAASAHPGHIEADRIGEAHWLTQGDHIAVVVLFVAAAALAVRRGRENRRKSCET